MTYPKVSIIVPIYKVEEFLEQCFAALDSQTYPDLEIINKIVPLNQNAFFPSAGHGIGTAISQKDTEYSKKLTNEISSSENE